MESHKAGEVQAVARLDKQRLIAVKKLRHDAVAYELWGCYEATLIAFALRGGV
jgi:hypothetical protein